jgi:hypothetical protein
VPSSTSSFDRLTAADRPGIAQPVPERAVPAKSWLVQLIAALAGTVLLVGLWEQHWRDYGAEPSYVDGKGLWSLQRRRIDNGEGNRTVLLGASRVLFDIDLDTWERLSGERPIQLALAGTSPMAFLEDLADDPHFTGRVLVGVAPDVFFSGYMFNGKALDYYRHESPSQRAGQWLSMHLLEPHLAFLDGDFALATVLHRQPWPLRPGMTANTRVRKLSVTAADRNTHMWRKAETDAQYQHMAQQIWIEGSDPPDAAARAENEATARKQIERAVKAVARLRERHVPVVFVRLPSGGEYLPIENRDFPRASTWDVLLASTGAPGIHFEDYPQMQGYWLPEWSHLATRERPRMTEAVYGIIAANHWMAPPN